MRPQLSVVIPVYNNWWLTARALRELERLRDESILFEVIVVDNASTDETQRAVEAFSWVRYLRHERNLNFAGACNAGVRIADAELVLFLNNDAYPLGDALTPMVRAFDREEAAIAGGALFFEDGVTQCAGLVVLPNAHWHYSCRNLPADLVDVKQSRDALGVSGAAMAVRTRWFLDNGGFDETFINGFEDVDLCMRARERGRAIAYVAGSRFAHYEAASAGRYEREAQNELQFYRRWSAQFRTIPRVARGEVGAVAIHAPSTLSPLSAAALADLEAALRSFGHPLVHGSIPPWQGFDKRFRRSAALGWCTQHPERAGVTVESSSTGMPAMRVRGAVDLRVPWLPCASPDRLATIPLRLSLDPSCTTVALLGFDADLAARIGRARVLVLKWGEELPSADVACVVVAGFTDESGFGNALLAQAGVPAVIIEGAKLGGLYAPDVALFVEGSAVADTVARLVTDVDTRKRYGRLLAADARRRFSPRRAAIRVVDLLCAARFGLERPAPASSDAPIPIQTKRPAFVAKSSR